MGELILRTRELGDILRERDRQDAKWGEQNHGDIVWLAILTEEVGEAAEALLQTREGIREPGDIYSEVVQIAAVSLAWLEALQRNGEKPWDDYRGNA